MKDYLLKKGMAGILSSRRFLRRRSAGRVVFLLVALFISVMTSMANIIDDPGTMTSYRGNNGVTYQIRIVIEESIPAGSVWGSGIYTDDSTIRRAAVHWYGLGVGTWVVYVRIREGQSSYSSTTRNGITSSSWGSWGGSYEFTYYYREGSGPPPSYTLHYIAEEGGTIDGPAMQTVAPTENGQAVTALSDIGWAFVQWSDGLTTVTRRDLNVTSNIVVAAQFEMVTMPEARNRFFRIMDPSPIYITGMSDGVISWDQPEGIEVTVEMNENLFNPSGWRRYTGIPGDESRGGVQVFDRNTPDGMVLIPGGINSGTNPRFSGESSVPATYSLTVEAFYMDRTLVTKAQWDEVHTWATHQGRGANIYTFDNAGSGKAANHPVHTVNWYDVVKWCNARSEKEGRVPVYSIPGQPVYRSGRPASYDDVVQNTSVNGYRLPTGMEWEFAARGGFRGRRFPWGDTVTHSEANYFSEFRYGVDISPTSGFHPTFDDGTMPYTSPVGSFEANGYGLYDIVGNVAVWCWDPSGSNRMCRSGGWTTTWTSLRCGTMHWRDPGEVFHNLGFRTVCR